MLDKSVPRSANTETQTTVCSQRDFAELPLASCAHLQTAGGAAAPGQNPHRHWENKQAPLGWTGTRPAVTPPAFRFHLLVFMGC